MVWSDKWGKQLSNQLYMLQILGKLVVFSLPHVLCHHALLPGIERWSKTILLLSHELCHIALPALLPTLGTLERDN